VIIEQSQLVHARRNAIYGGFPDTAARAHLVHLRGVGDQPFVGEPHCVVGGRRLGQEPCGQGLGVVSSPVFGIESQLFGGDGRAMDG
jgi:hypothetical protein